MQIDHKNGNKLCSTMSNMRLVTSRQKNNQNRKKHRAGRLVGATYDKERNCWQSRIRIDKTHIWLGRYKTEREAITSKSIL